MPDLQHPGRTQKARLVVLPAEIGIANARRIRERLAAAARPGVTTVIADMTATVWCDGEGAYSLAQARQQAAARGVDLRLAVPSADVRRVFQIFRLEGLVSLYPSVEAALVPAPAPAPFRPGSENGSG
jgi:anti-anti-sigma factor